MDKIWELRGSDHTGAHGLDFDDGTCTLNDFFATQGMSPLFQETEAYRCRDGSEAGRVGCGIYFGSGLGFAASSAALVRRASRAAPASACHICCALSFGRQL
jgi:hypothetical protein